MRWIAAEVLHRSETTRWAICGHLKDQVIEEILKWCELPHTIHFDPSFDDYGTTCREDAWALLVLSVPIFDSGCGIVVVPARRAAVERQDAVACEI